MRKILAIETSCDETAAAIVQEDRRILSQAILSQLQEHAPYGGVVPEIAARAHMDHLDRLIKQSLTEADVPLEALDAIAATAGPGLIGGVIVGVMTAKAIAAVTRKPFIAVNHLEGHALTVRLTDDVPFPYLLLLMSGGHCQIVLVKGISHYQRLGSTIDDAVGEAFDKVAKMLGLGYPGGPEVERCAKHGAAHNYPLPEPLKGKPGCDFSFSGLKTAVKRIVDTLGHPPTEQEKADICASFQYTVGNILCDRIKKAIQIFQDHCPEGKHVVVSGGVAANKYLRQQLEQLVSAHSLTFVAPPIKLCTDNAAMIGWAAMERLKLGLVNDLNFAPRARWPLDSLKV